MKSVVCDSSALISLADTCNIEALEFLRKNFSTSFLLTPVVKDEIISHPLKIKKFELSAVRLKQVLVENTLSVISSPTLVRDTQQVLEIANNLLLAGGKPLSILHEGEAQCLAIFASARAGALVIDEKTTRLLIEDPLKLRQVIQSEYEEKIEVNAGNLQEFKKRTQDILVLRSSELLAIAAMHGFFAKYKASEEEAFHASLYALKTVGCSLSQEELEEYAQVGV